ncbi:MAG TPA: hypothetical protein VFO16_09815 [Pseudonocardiaceae bacterium]|nr:hypothetical protein [Pseudonocardiaceae bacterium]
MIGNEWNVIDGSPGEGHFVATNGAGDFLRGDPTGWAMVDNTGQPIAGDLPEQIRLRVDPHGGVFTFWPHAGKGTRH